MNRVDNIMDYFTAEDLQDLWDHSEYAKEHHISEPFTEEMLAKVEAEIGGYQLPASYIELMSQQNGGYLQKDFFYAGEESQWADGGIWVSEIYGIGFDKRYSLCGEFGSNFWIEEWEYPEIGVCFAGTPSGGHEIYMLDYRECGKKGIPKVVHVDQESNYDITFIADTFEDFIKGLVLSEEIYGDE